MTTPAQVRDGLIDALRLDLVGPRPGEPAHARYAEEVLPTAPSSWYLTGFLVPYEAPMEQRTDDDGDDELDQGGRVGAGDDESTPEQTSARKAFFPSSIGLSVLVPKDTAQLQVKVAWGDYAPVPPAANADAEAAGGEPSGKGRRRGHWRRVPREAEVVVTLHEGGEPSREELAGSEGLQIVLSVRSAGTGDLLPAGTRSVSVFLVNHRRPAPDAGRDAAYVFQPELSLIALHPFVPRPNLRGRHSRDWDEKVADLQYRDAYEYAVGHNVSALAVTDRRGPGREARCREVRTAWMPTAEVEKVVATKIPQVELGMEALAAAADAVAVRAMVGPLVAEYGHWIERQREVDVGDAGRAKVAADLLANAERARDRIRAGLALLDEPHVVIQDELHLISGPLGTMVGLYETAIDALCQTAPGGPGARPKIVASTATVRRAEKQIRSLFGRALVDIFPPPGPDRRTSFFAETVSAGERHPRTYVGIAAQGRNLKVVLLGAYMALLAGAQKAWQEAGGAGDPDNPADPYMTLLGYFNSLRELGGSRRIVEDEVRSRLADYSVRRLRVGEARGFFADRKTLTEPRELTSRVSTNEVAETKRRLALGFHEKERVDVALATNMISVGLDITRLGLMVVLGQPKAAAEYIQATSRVGRDDERPGLVVVLLNVHRPRDRSHYESFAAWHESFYRAVEATSVTPFSPRAIDRGVAAVTVALARLGHSGLTAPRGAAAITRHRGDLDFVAETISRRAEAHDKDLSGSDSEALRQKVRTRVVDLLDTWESIAAKKGELQYQREVGAAPPLLFDPLDPELANQPQEARHFTAHRSLRDVEPTVKLWLRNPDGFDVEGPES